MNDVLVLVGHGSSDGENEKLIQRHAARIRQLGTFDQVCACFLYGTPGIEETLQNIRCDRVFIIPMFIAHGRHTKEDIPKALDVTENSTTNDREIIYCEPIGYNDKITDIILEQVAKKRD